MIALQLLLERAQHLALVLFIFHVDEVDDDDPAQVAQAQLPGDGRRRFQISLEDSLFEVPVPDERTGVDVNGTHRLGRIDHQITAGLEWNLALQRLLNLVFDAIQVENRSLARIVLQAIGDFRHQFGDKLRGPLERFPRIDANLLDLRADQIAQGAQGQAEVFVDHAGGTHRLDLCPDLVPETAQVANVHQDFIGTRPFGRGAQNEPACFLDAFFGNAIGDHLLEALALGFVFDLQRNTDVCRARHVHQIP
ncbi:hypothetical protein D3C84_420210 [compost metagenome]